MLYYALLTLASLLFAVQFLFQKRFQEVCGASLNASLIFGFYSCLCTLPLLFATGGFRLAFSWPTLLCAVACACVFFLFNYASIESLSSVNLGLYSVFAMLGGMALPFVYGICFLGEPLTIVKLVCFLVIGAAMFLTLSDVHSSSRKAILWYALVFVLNGMSSVISTVHQRTAGTVDSSSFLFYSKLLCALVCGAWYLLRTGHAPIVPKAALFSCASTSVVSTGGSLLLLIALVHLPSSVQYPIVSGGTMAFSAVISVLRKEKFTAKNAVSFALAVAASVIIAL